jgi:hypothetical protein
VEGGRGWLGRDSPEVAQALLPARFSPRLFIPARLRLPNPHRQSACATFNLPLLLGEQSPALLDLEWKEILEQPQD